MSRQPISALPFSSKATSLLLKRGLIAIALGSLCLAPSQSGASSQLIQPALKEVAELPALLRRPSLSGAAVSADRSLKGSSLQGQRSSQHSSKLQGMRYVWNRHWLPRDRASQTSFSVLEKSWFSWYRWWQLQEAKSKAAKR
ncbi:hypothetical protein IFO70_23980 [Phormidium tenue FACHB-886]|nr:hypothetical protein [Phormidium tenue FACHB-886]